MQYIKTGGKMSDYLKAIHDDIRELRADVKDIGSRMPELATKTELNQLQKKVDHHGFIFKACVWVGGGIWALIKVIIPNIGH